MRRRLLAPLMSVFLAAAACESSDPASPGITGTGGSQSGGSGGMLASLGGTSGGGGRASGGAPAGGGAPGTGGNVATGGVPGTGGSAPDAASDVPSDRPPVDMGSPDAASDAPEPDGGAPHDVTYGIAARVPNPTCKPPRPPAPVPTGDYGLAPLFPNLVTGAAGSEPASPIVARRVRMPSATPDPARPGKVLPGPWVWFVALRSGRIFAMTDLNAAAPPAVSLRAATFTRPDLGESGFLDMDFDPDIATDPTRAHVYLSDAVFARHSVKRLSVVTTPDGNGGFTYTGKDEVEVLRVWGGSHHYGGEGMFGPDGYLYVSVGDDDIKARSQSPRNMMGKILRIDVHSTALTPYYGIPESNPYRLAGSGTPNPACSCACTDDAATDCPEVYAVGFRNPWRLSFDRQSHALWVGDVGAAHEEINRVELGKNYGWDTYEGAVPKNNAAFVPSVAEIPRSGCTGYGYAIIGGYVYRGSAIPSLQGKYVTGDNDAGKLYVLEDPYGANPTVKLIYNGDCAVPGFKPSTFVEDEAGELYVVSLNATAGKGVFKIVPKGSEPPPPASGPPGKLSETGCFDPQRPAEPIAAAIPFAVNAELWSDGLAKRRWMVLPDGQKIDVLPGGDLDLPNGTVLIKEFSKPAGKRVETRLLVRQEDGAWSGTTYLWNANDTEAVLADAAGVQVSLDDGGPLWSIPGRQQCLACHGPSKGGSLGLEVGQLNRTFVYPGNLRANQLATLDHLGVLDPPIGDPALAPVLPPPFGTAPVAQRARAYLDANCSHCHPGPGAKPNFRYATALPDMRVCNEDPTSPVPGGTKLLAPGDPDHSVILLRVKDLGAYRMPKIGSRRVHTAAADLLTSWIAGTTCP